MELNRRLMIGAVLAGGAALAGGVAFSLCDAASASAAAHASVEDIALWPGAPPGPGGTTGPERDIATGKDAGTISNVARPRLRVYRPATANGKAMLAISGGGYAQIQSGKESAPACRLLAGLGYVAFELIYRLPADGWPPEAPFADAQRAMRLIRANAGRYGFAAADVGILGFSAGGHLAGMTAAAPDAMRYQPVDAADSQSARPILAGLIYPVITLQPPFDVTRSGRELIGRDPSAAQSAAWSVQTHVDASTPPTFLAQAIDDPVSPVDNSLVMLAALRKAGVACEAHLFRTGGHGWGLGAPGSEVAAWPGLFERFIATLPSH